MKALVKTGPHPGLELRDMPVPALKENDILIEVRASGICGSDIHIYDWSGSYGFMQFPRIPGHEYAGVIVDQGKGVPDSRIGKRVIGGSMHACGQCKMCREGKPGLCLTRKAMGAPGLHRDGAYAQYIAVPWNSALDLPEELSFADGALVEPMDIAMVAVKSAWLEMGDHVLIMGPGPIGLMTLLFARLQGAANIIVAGTGRDGMRLAMAKELGAAAVCNVETEDLKELVMDLTGGQGADAAFECTGCPPCVQQCLDLTKRSGNVVVTGIHPGPVQINVTAMVREAKSLIGAYGGAILAERVVKMLQATPSLLADVRRLVTHEIPLEAFEAAFERLHRCESLKELFVF